MKPVVYISSGDINGTGLELMLKNHTILSKKYELIYCVDKDILERASNILKLDADIKSMNVLSVRENITRHDRKKLDGLEQQDICPCVATAFSGFYSFKSFQTALRFALEDSKKLVTLPVNKYAWSLSGVKFIGHTEYLRYFFKRDAIMMLGNKRMFVALFTDHIPLRKVAKYVTFERFSTFLLNLYSSYVINRNTEVLVLGLNPHAGDTGVIGKEDFVIRDSINYVNSIIKNDIFKGPTPPDTAFIKANRDRFKVFVAPYHDIGIATLKALYFDNSINVSLNIGINRSSPDHGTGYDIAYRNSPFLKSHSYINSVTFSAEETAEKLTTRDQERGHRRTLNHETNQNEDSAL